MARRPPILIVGGSPAGLATALAAAPSPVWLLSHTGDGNDTADAMIQQGLAAALSPGDSPDAHARDTLIAGMQHNDIVRTQWLCAQAPATVGWLDALGVHLATVDNSSANIDGHSVRRIMAPYGNVMDASLVNALQDRVCHAPHIRQYRGVTVEALLMRGARVVGLRFHDAGGTQHICETSSVVLAQGGVGALFAHSSQPPSSDGAQLALGLAAGAMPRDLEFIQFQPVALDIGTGRSLPLVPKVLRSLGSRLQTANMRPLMTGIHPAGDLAPCDIVARRAWQAHCEDGRLWLDATHLDSDGWRCAFTFMQTCQVHGFDPRRQLIPVVPAAHFHMGGLAVDGTGRTHVPGLHAVGEVACNGTHGANLLPGNALLEAIVCGRRLGTMLAMQDTYPRGSGRHRWVRQAQSASHESLTALRELLWHAAGPIRRASPLRIAWRTCRMHAGEGWQMDLATRLLETMLARADGLGVHYRSDGALVQPSCPDVMQPRSMVRASLHGPRLH